MTMTQVSMLAELEAWEDEGGALPSLVMKGTAAQIEWAERIRRTINTEFDRVAASFRSIALKQRDEKRADTETIIAMLEEKRVEVMSRNSAGYFIREWQEIGTQVRNLIFNDSRYKVIARNRADCRPQAEVRQQIHGRRTRS